MLDKITSSVFLSAVVEEGGGDSLDELIQQLEKILAAIIGVLVVVAIVSLIIYILTVIAYWKIFTKAGEAGWKSIIPIYNTYIQFKITWNTNMFWVYLGLAVIGSVLESLAIQNENKLLLILACVFLIALLVIGIISYHKLSKAFGHGVGFTIGLIFLPTLFILILGLGSSEYVGIDGNDDSAGYY